MKALGAVRPVEPRLTGGFSHAPWIPDRTGSRVPAAVQLATARLELAITDHESERGATVSIGHLLLGNADRAIDGLRRAAEIDAPDARVLSDLAAAYLARAPSNDRPTDALAALDAAAHAVVIDPNLVEARFNLALALEALHVPELAAETWSFYERLDPASPWALEARAHRSRLEATVAGGWDAQRARLSATTPGFIVSDEDLAQILQTNPQLVREQVDDVLLPAWAEKELSDEASAAKTLLQQAERLAGAAREAQGDPLTADAVTAIRAHPSCTRALARSHQRFAAGRSLYLAGRYAEADPVLRESEAGFRRCNSSFAVWAAQHRAVIPFFVGDMGDSLSALDAVEAEAARGGYVNVIGRAKWMRAIILTARSEALHALREYRSAEALFTRSHERDGLLSVWAGIAEDLRDLGEMEESWRPRLSALQVAQNVRPFRRHAAYWLAATGAEESAYYHAADWLLEQTWRNAVASGRPTLAAEAHMRRMSVRHRLGQQTLADADLAAARSFIAQIPDAQVQARSTAELAAIEASLWRTLDPERALTAIEQAFAFFRPPDWRRRLPGLYLTRGRARMARQQWTEAAKDFEAGIASFEAIRSSIPPGGLRDSFADEGAELFDDLVWTHWVGTGRRDLALACAERGRAAALARELRVPPVAAPEALAKVLPSALAVVYFGALPDRVVTWTLRRSGVQSFEQRIERRVLEREVDRFVASLRDDDPGDTVQQAGARLYDILLAPALAGVEPGATLIFVPHGVLHRVPFAALFDAKHRQYVVERHAVGVTPSLGVLVHASSRLNRLGVTPPGAVLSIGNPTVGADELGTLGVLREAAREARDVAATYPSAHLLEGSAATRSGFLSSAANYDVVHIAAHAIANAQRPELSRLLLAPDPSREFGAVYPSDIARLSFKRTRVVALAACRTGDGRTSASEGLLSLARPFLARGVPTVVATLWDVDDRASRLVFTAFHRALRAGSDSWAALREAQLQLLTSRDPIERSPSQWAAYTVFGAPSAMALGSSGARRGVHVESPGERMSLTVGGRQ